MMTVILQLLLLYTLIVTGFLLYRRYKRNLLKKKEDEEKLAIEQEEARQKLFQFYKSKLGVIKVAIAEFENFLDIETGYFTNNQMSIWINQWENLFNEIEVEPFEDIRLDAEEVNFIQKFIEYFLHSDKWRDSFNRNFLTEELKRYSAFFDNIEGRKLDIQQRTAVISDEDNNLVIAGAGSGKTTTIVGKVNYIIDRYNVSPGEILLISFTNKSASTLAKRINIEGIEAKTFHKFGKDIIAQSEGKQPSIFDEKQFKPLLAKCFVELLKGKSYFNKVTEYFTDFLKPVKSRFEFDNQGDYIQYMKDQNFRTYKLIEVSNVERTTYKMEVVKSIEECKIANFLLFNGIEYEYEFPYEFETATETHRQYKPDFTVKQNSRKIYLEHYGVARNGDVPRFFAKDGQTVADAKAKYWEKIHWARELHEANKTVLIETFSYEMTENILFENLTLQLRSAGFELHPKSSEEKWQIISQAAKDEINSFITLIETFITLMKSNNYSIRDLNNKNKQTLSRFFRERNALFIEIIGPIFEMYQQHLSDRNEIDFSDMINKASKLIANGRLKRKFSYVIIDEFQDISIGRYQIVKAIKEIYPACKLFCVGDDWQSIYRFSGSDISLFNDFESYFGYSVKSKIETTYRFHSPLINLSSDFIQRNPGQVKKNLRSISGNKNTNYEIRYSSSENQDDTAAVQSIFNHLLATDKDIQNKEIYILGRYSFDFARLKNENYVFRINKQEETISYSARTREDELKNLRAQFMTVHKAKGLEAEIIIIINCNSGKLGFPCEMSDDQVLNLLLSRADQFENGEERRLFYVAMTRAKEKVYFVTDRSYKSKFITELEVETGQSPNKKCPNCRNADVVLIKTGIAKNGATYKFYGCTNYYYGCDYTKTEWGRDKGKVG